MFFFVAGFSSSNGPLADVKKGRKRFKLQDDTNIVFFFGMMKTIGLNFVE